MDTGLPMYLALERKPDNGGEIQNHADVVSGIMLHLKVVNYQDRVMSTSMKYRAGSIRIYFINHASWVLLTNGQKLRKNMPKLIFFLEIFQK